jgi:predicted HTH domain antitoxin
MKRKAPLECWSSQAHSNLHLKGEREMSVSIAIEFPETVFSALRRPPKEFVQEMRLAAAVKWYELQLISQAKAAEIAGINRHAFLKALSRFNVSPFQLTPEELLDEVERD